MKRVMLGLAGWMVCVFAVAAAGPGGVVKEIQSEDGYEFEWQGKTVVFRPNPKFYGACCAELEKGVKEMRGDADAEERGVGRVFQRMLTDFRNAKNGQPVSEAVLATNSWSEVLKVNVGGKTEEAAAADYGVFSRGVWEVTETPVRQGDGWDSIVWSYTIGGEGEVVTVAGRKVRVDGKAPTTGEKKAKTEGTLKLVGTKGLGVVTETNYKGRQLRGRWELEVAAGGRTFSGVVYEERKPATKLRGRWVKE